MRIKLLLGIVALLAPAAPASAAPRQQRDDTGRLLPQHRTRRSPGTYPTSSLANWAGG